MQTKDVSLIILAGGKSSRMGQEKSDLIYRGKSFLAIQADKAKQLGISDVIISGYRGSRQPDYPVLQDDRPEQGPLGGMATCLGAVKNEWALVLSVDAPLVPASELEKLIAFALGAEEKAVITQAGAHQYPLIGMYHRSLIPAMREEVTQRRGSVFSMLRHAGFAVFESTADPTLFSNVNDPESYLQLMKR